jgi:hypothetical protein
MCSVVSLNQPAPPALRVVRVTAVVVTVLALAGAVATAALIFAAGFTVLWPALIACACLAVIGAVGFLIDHCVISSRGRRKVEGYITCLAKMPKDMSIKDALLTLKKKKNASISDRDIANICDFIAVFARIEGDSPKNLGDLLGVQHTERDGNMLYLSIESLSNSLPTLIAILSLFCFRFFIQKTGNGCRIKHCPSDGKCANMQDYYLSGSSYVIINYGKSPSAGQKDLIRSAIGEIGRNNTFVSHYKGDGTLVVDSLPRDVPGPTRSKKKGEGEKF